MNLLLDTHILLWASTDPARLSRSAALLLANPANTLIFSAASMWEIAIKLQLGRDDFQIDPRLLRRGLLDNGYHELAITSAHTLAVLDLPPLHRDPFDRLLIAQAKCEGFTLMTADALVAQYPISLIRA